MSTVFEAAWKEAHEAGEAAVSALKVVPMVVGTETHLFSGDLDNSKPTYFVEDGVCGFASVHVKPATSQFARWAKNTHRMHRDEYLGGVYMSVSAYNQSLQKKEAYARAFAKVLRDNLDINARVESRMD
ncbi:MAG: hypothetical protein WCY93_11265 [Anaerolineaceae bacterium]